MFPYLGLSFNYFWFGHSDKVVISRKTYKWFYNHVHSLYYNPLMTWCFLPFGGEKKCRRTLIEPVQFSAKDTILDMCCGTGGVTLTIAEKVTGQCKIIGVDLSANQIDKAIKRNRFQNVDFLVCDAAQSGFRANSFNQVFITHALHEMVRDERLTVLIEAKRVMLEDGQIVILEIDRPDNRFIRLFTAFWYFYWLPFNFETATRKDMLEQGIDVELAEVGFRNIQKYRCCGGIFQILVADR